MTQKKKRYQKPKVVHHEKIEVLAAVCGTGWQGGLTCMKVGTCQAPRAD